MERTRCWPSRDTPIAAAAAVVPLAVLLGYKLGDASVNLTTAYLATNTRLALAADNLADAKSALA